MTDFLQIVRLPALLICGSALAACGDNTVGGWFNTAPPETLEPEGGYTPVVIDNRGLVASVTSLKVENTPGGAIVLATGLPPTQGYWNVDLVLVDEEDRAQNELRYEFRVREPISPSAAGSQNSRDLEVAAFATNIELQGIRQITVVGESNSRSVRR